MADTVRYLMEEMIPELEDLEQKGYFSRAEVKQIAQKRQGFEYHLKRRAALKRDFLRYIDYECKLEELRKHRRKARGIKVKKNKGLAEMGITRRVHFIYERATRKFKADLSLWLAWLEYCKRSKSTKQFSKVVTKALHRHSHVSALWVEAAVWEFEHTGNVAAARALMQQGLRHCQRDEALWAEYLRLELLYVTRLRARRAVLGLPNPEAAEDFQAPAPKVKRKRKLSAGAAALPADSDEEGAGGEAAAATAAGGGTDAAALDAEAAVRAVLTGSVARVVIKGAIAAAPTQLSMRMRMLRVLGGFSFPGVSQLADFVYDGIASDFSGQEGCYDVLARRHWQQPAAEDATSLKHLPPSFTTAAAAAAGGHMEVDGVAAGGGADEQDTDQAWEFEPSGHQRCREAYEAGIAALPASPTMREMYVRYLGQRTLPVWAAAQRGNTEAVQPLATLGAQLLASYQAALDAKCASEVLCSGYVDWAMALGQPKLAVKAARRACELHPGSTAVWSRRLALEVELHARKRSTPQEVVSVLQAALKDVAAAQSEALWRHALTAAPPGSSCHPQLQQLLVSSLRGSGKGPVQGGMGAVVGELLRQTCTAQGLDATRELFKQLVSVPPAGGDMFHAMLDIEQDALKQLTTGGGAAAGAAAAVQAQAGIKAAGSGVAGAAHRKEAEAAVRRVFEMAVDAYGAVDTQLWLRYAQFEQGALKGVGDVYWRATKALDDPDTFIEQYRNLLGASA